MEKKRKKSGNKKNTIKNLAVQEKYSTFASHFGNAGLNWCVG